VWLNERAPGGAARDRAASGKAPNYQYVGGLSQGVVAA